MNKELAIDSALSVLNDPLFKALQEPARLAVIRQLLILGKADISQIAEDLPQERSVISRHLQVLLDAGILRVERAGRHRIYEINDLEIIHKFEAILKELKLIMPYCCN
ncbi:Arsenical resistance operon repressor [compost metagenome]